MTLTLPEIAKLITRLEFFLNGSHFTLFHIRLSLIEGMAPTVQRKQFSLEDKKNIISEVDKGFKKGKVAKKYGISPSTLSTFLKGRENILKQLQSSVLGPSRKRMYKAQLEYVDVVVFKWFQDVCSKNNRKMANF